MNSSKDTNSGSDAEALAKLAKSGDLIAAEVGKIIVGQIDVIGQILTAFFARGHVVIEGVPGLAKTLMINSLAETMSLDFTRVQFTPDLMPTDITGTTLLNEDEHGKRHFTFSKGPVFTNILLADEINRTPPKTQAALLEAMQERNVSVGGETYKLPRAVPRAGHPEPDRAGGHIYLARSTARSVPVPDQDRLSRRSVKNRRFCYPPHWNHCRSWLTSSVVKISSRCRKRSAESR